MRCEVEFYHERGRSLARYSVDAAHRLSLFEQAQRIGGQDASGWVLHRIAAR